MSTTKLDTSGFFQPVTVRFQETELLLSIHDVVVRKNGIEFFSPKAIPAWTELTVDLRTPCEGRRVRGTGVVVDCTGNRHTGFVVSLMFTSLSRQSQECLGLLAHAQRA